MFENFEWICKSVALAYRNISKFKVRSLYAQGAIQIKAQIHTLRQN